MSRAEKEARGMMSWQKRMDKELKLAQMFAQLYSNLWGYMEDELRPGTMLKVLAREDGYLAIAQRWDEDRYYCVFASGSTMWEAILELNKSMAADTWRLDKYANSW